MTELRYIDALNAAMRVELGDDPLVYVIGEDVTAGGPFGATKGLVDAFGHDRVLDTPISEETVMGTATGSALLGHRPVLEIMFSDFLPLAMNQLVNHAAKLRYMSGGQLRVPLTVRAQQGVGGAMGAQHSQSLEAWFAHVPGLKVVAPATPADAYGLLRAAIRDDDPVLLLEHRGLYWRRGEVDESAGPATIGEAAIRRPGDDVTLVALSKAVEWALEAADGLAQEGIEAEVVDVRSVQPLDLDLLAASVARTGRAVVVHEAVVTGGIGAEIAAALSERVFDELRAPVMRVGAPFAPVPASPALEALYAPGADAVVAAARALVSRRTAVRGAV